MRKKTWIGTAALAATGLALAGCSGGDAEAGDGADDLTAVTVAMTGPSCLNYYGFYVAAEEGFFADEGLDVTPQALDGSASVLQAMAAEQAEFGTVGPGPGLNARAQGEDVVFVYNWFTAQIFNLVTPESTGVTDLAGLEGKVIGVGTVDGTEVAMVHAMMAGVGIAEDTYEVMPVGDGGLASASLIRGEISAYIGNAADVATINSTIDEPTVNLTPDDVRAQFSNGVAVYRDYLEENTEVVEGLGRALARASEWSQENPEGANATCAEENPEESADEAYAAALLKTNFDLTTPLADGDPWGYYPEEGWQMWLDAQTESGEVPAGWDGLPETYTNDYVDAFNDF